MSATSHFLTQRPRRNRLNASVRGLVCETSLTPAHLVLPVFVQPGEKQRHPISSLPGCERLSIDLLVELAKEAVSVGVMAVAIFPAVPEELKTKNGEECLNPDGLVQRSIKALKAEVPHLLVITDVALDPYSSDGQDGYVNERGEVDNDITLPLLAGMAVAQAKAGADIVAPSDMMDARVGVIRQALDAAGYPNVLICSYSVKFCSAFYGPFRDALDSAPRGGGDKKTYQMDPANTREALREVALDEAEGADWVMVKPGLPYLDVVRRVRDHTSLPVAVYHVSGEFAMLKAAALNGWLDYKSCLLESLLSMRRAGADIIFTYGAIDAARFLKE
eukprot:TRINITY_DN11002_c0_g1_i1.p1 TRINITY_DN11002_c0_g1~~TRINITY_DN11002_c0_g1_i1.p1  ORF type:complete len:333 (+),score=57.89 TRINITY_DN11002_c0_g1_i1:174-1172(+)